MNLGRFHFAINFIVKEFDNFAIIQKLNTLQSALQNSISSPNEQNTKAFREAYSDLAKTLESCKTNDATPTEKKIFDEIGASQYIGIGLLKKISRIISDNNITPANAFEEIKILILRIDEFHNYINSINIVFKELKIEYYELKTNEAQIGIAIPPELINSNLEGLEKEAHEFNRVFKTFYEVVGERVESIKIRTLSSSDFELFLASIPIVAALLATAIERIVALYKNVLEIKKLRYELAKQKVPKKNIKPVEEYENSVVNQGLEDISKALIEENYKGEEGRKNELRTGLKMALRILADRIDHGVLVEVKVGEPEEPEVPEDSEEGKKPSAKELAAYRKQKQLAEGINRRGRALTQLKRGDKPILLLSTDKSRDEETKENDNSVEKVI